MDNDPVSKRRRAIQRARARNGWTQTDLAREAGCSPSLISRIESGDTKGSPSKLLAIATALGIEIDDLIDRLPQRARRVSHPVAA